ncbi:hypothetical protein ACFL6Q_01860 [Candidatus Neomarinimicrobiota bacterium]
MSRIRKIMYAISHALAGWLNGMHDWLTNRMTRAREVYQALQTRISRPIRAISEIPILRLAIVVPIAVMLWLLVERVVPAILQFLLEADLFVTVFLSHFIAVVSAAYIAPRIYSRQAIIVIAIIFISVRLIMGVALLSDETDTNHLSLVVDVLSALAGLALGTLWFFHRTRSRADKQ